MSGYFPAPNSALAHYVKGQVLRAQSRCKDAIPEFGKAGSVRAIPPLSSKLAELGEAKEFNDLIRRAIAMAAPAPASTASVAAMVISGGGVSVRFQKLSRCAIVPIETHLRLAG